MALGYCARCGRLVSIVARELKSSSARERNWYPEPHYARVDVVDEELFFSVVCSGSKDPL